MTGSFDMVGGILLCGAVAVIGALVLGFGAIFMRTLRNAGPVVRGDQRAYAEQWLDQQQAQLLPWRSDSINNVSIRRGFEAGAFPQFKAHGIISAQSAPQGLISFYAFARGSDTVILARTTAHRWELQVQGLGGQTVDFALNGQPFGRFVEGALLDPAGQQKGNVTEQRLPAQSPEQDASWFYGVELRGQIIGEVTYMTGARDEARLQAGEGPPAAVAAKMPLEPEAELWLLALVILYLVQVDIVWDVRHSRSRVRPGRHVSAVGAHWRPPTA